VLLGQSTEIPSLRRPSPAPVRVQYDVFARVEVEPLEDEFLVSVLAVTQVAMPEMQ
jgi:hypothetical protein